MFDVQALLQSCPLSCLHPQHPRVGLRWTEGSCALSAFASYVLTADSSIKASQSAIAVCMLGSRALWDLQIKMARSAGCMLHGDEASHGFSVLTPCSAHSNLCIVLHRWY